ncbi:hypothetical protein Q644_25960 [Brucella intermedia 229E]|uniref:Uncharacterized protein n=1 Tax=Brucella intermedia 229E TaxID=1337887 RepID=U4V7A9_9HYPH|nr:hypothetical protein Q644_25960 [Brucella intermedia 229E]
MDNALKQTLRAVPAILLEQEPLQVIGAQPCKNRPKKKKAAAAAFFGSADCHQAGIATRSRGVDRGRNFFQKPIASIGFC